MKDWMTKQIWSIVYLMNGHGKLEMDSFNNRQLFY